MKSNSFFLISIVLFLSFYQSVKAQLNLDVEAGVVFTGYNDVRIPGSTGDFLSLSDELKWKPNIYSRLKVGFRFFKRNEVTLLYAPLKIEYKGNVDYDVMFMDVIYPAGTSITATYKFNSYRGTYRYYLFNREKLELALGLTIKVRDALIGFQGPGRESMKTDLGAVPLVNFNIHWKPVERWGVQLEGDALAAPQGRAEDVMLSVNYKATNSIRFKSGYRVLEGGADNASVYTFSMFHYGFLGVMIFLD